MTPTAISNEIADQQYFCLTSWIRAFLKTSFFVGAGRRDALKAATVCEELICIRPAFSARNVFKTRAPIREDNYHTMKIFFIIFALAFAIVTAHRFSGKPQCGRNEHWSASTCNSCDRTCRYPTSCNLMCYPPQCMCNEGFLRDDKKRCIPAHECPTKFPNEPRVTDGFAEFLRRLGYTDYSLLAADTVKRHPLLSLRSSFANRPSPPGKPRPLRFGR
uniref:TIL domain-containing protein n=1 Tax=Steinernema glaseri TaxID=37863 RepID=A0A1I7YUA0_9BILA